MELQIVTRINHLGKGTWIDSFSLMISRMPLLTGLFMVIGIFLFMECPQKRKQLLISLAVGSLLFLLVNELAFKHLLVDVTGIRLRPYAAHQDLITPIGKQFSDSSFPSSHMASTVMILTILIRMFPMSRPVAIIFILLMGFSRMHNGMHYPSDVLAGMILGVLYGIGALRASKKRKKYIHL